MSRTSAECPIVVSPKLAELSGVATAAAMLFLEVFLRAGPSSTAVKIMF